MELTQLETETLTALMDRIIPADDFPSASDADVMVYILRLLDSDLRARRDWLSAGLSSLLLEAIGRKNVSFASLPDNVQDEVITDLLSNNPTATWSISPGDFIRAIINMVSEGYYADPSNGANKNCASWDMIGFTVAEGVRFPLESTL